jgi:predicted Rossmann fold nucleotide-binding protein DprA/Smf involved in DNA uptake
MDPSGRIKRKALPLMKVRPGGPDFPLSLMAHCMEVPLNVLGDPGLLRLPAMGLFCSVKCPGAVILRTYDAMQRLKLHDRVIAGGFHSPMELTCLDILLRGRVKLILCPARGIERLRVRLEWRNPLEVNRLVIVSPFDGGSRRSTVQLASARNRFVAALSTSLLIPFAARRSRTERFAVDMLSAGKQVYTFSCPESRPLVDLGASILDV